MITIIKYTININPATGNEMKNNQNSAPQKQFPS